MAAAVGCLSSSCLSLHSKFTTLSLTNSSSQLSFRPLGFSSNLSLNVFSKGHLSMNPVERPNRRGIVCEAAPKKKVDSAVKRARQAEKRRIYNKSRKSEMKTRMKKPDYLPCKTEASKERQNMGLRAGAFFPFFLLSNGEISVMKPWTETFECGLR